MSWSRFLVPPPISPARGPPTDWGELMQVHDDRAIFQATDRRAARDRHPQPLTAAGREVTTKPPGGGIRRDSAPTREKRHFRREVADPGTRFLGRDSLGRREQPTHEPLSSSATLVEVQLTGLSFILPWAQAMLHLRALFLNGRWDEFIDHHVQTEQTRLYRKTAA